MQYSYLHLDRKPNPDKEILITYRIGCRPGQLLESTAEKVAAESSVGTWTPTETLSPKVFREMAAYVYEIDRESGLVRIAYPLDLFEPGSLPQMASGIMGNIFSMKDLRSLRMEEIELPADYINSFPGPSFGAAGIRNLLNIRDRPIVGSIMKPKIGLNPRENAELAYQVWKGGVDLVRDDENLTDLAISPFKTRVIEAMRMLRRAQEETGRTKVYAFNVSGPVDRMTARANLVAKEGGTCLMVDIIATGWSGVQELRRVFPKMIIYGHRAGHSTFTRSPNQGLSMMILAVMSRLAGIDQLHTGAVVGKMEGQAGGIMKINEFLSRPWGKLKNVLPIASGGLHPGMISDLLRILGHDLIINFGGSIHGHPDGSKAGAEAARTAVEAAIQGEPLIQAAQRCPALARALNYWS